MGLFRFYPPVMLLQGFCLYHAYSNKAESKWYYLIIFLPLIGSAIYLFDAFYSKENVNTVSEGLKSVINPDHEVEKLLKKAKFSDTVSNKLKLANEYYSRKDFHKAIMLYEACMTGFYKTDYEINGNLLRSYYQLEEYEPALKYGEVIQNEEKFKKSPERVAYAWCLHKTGDSEAAEQHFKDFNVTFSNYLHRIEYAKFLKESDRKEEAKNLLTAMKEEIESLEDYARKMKREESRMIRSLLNEF